MTIKQTVYMLITILIVICVTFFAASNFQDVDATIPFVGTFHTKLFVVIVISFIAGYITASVVSILSSIIPGRNSQNKNKQDAEN